MKEWETKKHYSFFTPCVVEYMKKNQIYAKEARELGLISQGEYLELIPTSDINNMYVHADISMEKFRTINKNKDMIERFSMFNIFSVSVPSCEQLASELDKLLDKCSKEKNLEQVCENDKYATKIGRFQPAMLFDSSESGVADFRRNAVVKNKLNESLENGDKKIVIIYGAAHMRDFEYHLRNLGFEQTDKKWLSVLKY